MSTNQIPVPCCQWKTGWKNADSLESGYATLAHSKMPSDVNLSWPTLIFKIGKQKKRLGRDQAVKLTVIPIGTIVEAIRNPNYASKLYPL